MSTITLGELIRQLELCGDQSARVRFDFGYFIPGSVASYRGSYDHLAIEYRTAAGDISVAELLAVLRAADGETFTGWKGGEFTMGERTPVWVANSGEYTGTGIRGVREFGTAVVIDTVFIY